MSYSFYRKWPLSYRPSRRPPVRIDPDDLLRRTPAELVEMFTGRMQQLSTEPACYETPSPVRVFDDLQLLGLVVIRLIDVLEQHPGLKHRLTMDWSQ